MYDHDSGFCNTEFLTSLITKGDKIIGKDVLWYFGDDSWGSDEVVLYIADSEMASVKIEEFPGCCGICIITDLYVTHRNKGYGTLLIEAALQRATTLGYSLAVATTIDEEVTTKISKSLKAKNVASFRNRKTGNTVRLWTKALLVSRE